MEEPVGYATAAGTVKPVRFPPMPCPTCGTVETPVLGPGTGPHVGRLTCRSCHGFIRWASRRVVQAFLEEKKGGMGASINKVFLMGTISKYGVTVTYATSGTPCASFTLVVSEHGQDGRDHQTFIDCEVFGRKAEAAGELEAGQLALFEGKLAKRRKGEQWETIVAGYELMPVVAPMPALSGTSS